MKIVLDSNVLIAAFATRGLCDVVFEHCISEHQIATSRFVLDEVKKNLGKKLKLPQSTISEIESFLKTHCEIHPAPKLGEKVSRDPDDDNILSLAVHSSSDMIITGDRDLLVLKSYKNIPIITPRDFADLIRNKKD